MQFVKINVRCLWQLIIRNSWKFCTNENLNFLFKCWPYIKWWFIIHVMEIIFSISVDCSSSRTFSHSNELYLCNPSLRSEENSICRPFQDIAGDTFQQAKMVARPSTLLLSFSSGIFLVLQRTSTWRYLLVPSNDNKLQFYIVSHDHFPAHLRWGDRHARRIRLGEIHICIPRGRRGLSQPLCAE